MSIKHISLVVISGLFLAGCSVAKTPTPNPSPMAEASPQPVAMKKISLTEIAQHHTADDCWFAIEGGVYNVTSYIAGGKHPGGEAILQGCGQDATEIFNTRPMGSKTPHSDKARAYLQNFKIGELATDSMSN